jgi:thioredoxin 1
MIAPILDEIATEYKDKLRVAKIDIESNPDAAELRHSQIPT